jgi:ferredoxin-NADP reductase
MAMLRLARATDRADLVRLAVSVRSPADLLYADELTGPGIAVAYTRQAPPTSERPAGRLTAADLAPLLLPDATAYVCGSAGFADAASRLLVGLDVPVAQIRVERFGPSAPVGA